MICGFSGLVGGGLSCQLMPSFRRFSICSSRERGLEDPGPMFALEFVGVDGTNSCDDNLGTLGCLHDTNRTALEVLNCFGPQVSLGRKHLSCRKNRVGGNLAASNLLQLEQQWRDCATDKWIKANDKAADVKLRWTD